MDQLTMCVCSNDLPYFGSIHSRFFFLFDLEKTLKFHLHCKTVVKTFFSFNKFNFTNFTNGLFPMCGARFIDPCFSLLKKVLKVLSKAYHLLKNSHYVEQNKIENQFFPCVHNQHLHHNKVM